MKFRFAALTAALYLTAAAAPAFAQGLSVKAGFNFANQSTNEENDPGEDCCHIKTGFAGGVAYELPFSPALSIQPELLYVQHGTKVEFDGTDDRLVITYNSIDVPVLLKANFSGGAAKPFVTAGPVFGFQVGDAKIEFGDESEVINDETESMNVAFALGGGIEIRKLIVEVRYAWGLKDLSKDDDETAKTRDFLLLFGVRF